MEDPLKLQLLNLVPSLNYLTDQLIFTYGIKPDGVSVGIGAGGVVGDTAMLGVLANGIYSGTAFAPLAGYVCVDKLIELTYGNYLMAEANNLGAVVHNPPFNDKGLDIKVLNPDKPLKAGVNRIGVGVDSIWFEIGGKNYYNPDLVLPLEKIFSRHYDAIVIPSVRMRMAYYEAVFMPKPNCVYFQARMKEAKYILRYNYAEKTLEILAKQDRFFVKEAASYLNDDGLWLADNRVLSINSLRSLEYSGDYLRGMVYGFGVGVDINTGKPTVFDSTADCGLAVAVATGTPYPVFFEPETGRMIVPSIKGVILESYLRRQPHKEIGKENEPFKIGLGEGVYATIKEAPRARVISLNSTYYIFDAQAVRNLPTVVLENDYEVSFGVERLFYKKGTIVTFLEPFAKRKVVNGKEVSIPAIVEYGEDPEAEGKFTYLEGNDKRYSERFPFLTYRDKVKTEFWEGWISTYDAMIQGMVNIPENLVNIPSVRIEAKKMPQGRGFKFVPYEYTLHIGWPGNGSKVAFGAENNPDPDDKYLDGKWARGVSISLGTLCDLQLKFKPDVEFEGKEDDLVSGHLRPTVVENNIVPLRDGKIDTIRGLFQNYLLTPQSLSQVPEFAEANKPLESIIGIWPEGEGAVLT